MSITKIAFARGVVQGLQRANITAYNHREGVNKLAFEAAKLLSVDPAIAEVPQADVLKIAEYFNAWDHQLAQVGKTASTYGSPVFYTSEDEAIGDLMAKTARRVYANVTGTSVSEPQPQNDLMNAAMQTNLGQAEQARRPEEYANVGQGNTNFSEPQAARVGVEQPHPHQQGGSEGTTNSAAESSKAAHVRNILNKVSNVTGTSVSEPQPQNDLMNAAMQTNLGQAEQARRPEEYANVGQGNTNFSEPQAARVGVEQPHPHQQGGSAGTTNSAAEASKVASVWDTLYATTRSYVNTKLAQDYSVRLNAGDQDKVTRQLITQDPATHDEFLFKVATHVKNQHAQTVGGLLQSR